MAALQLAVVSIFLVAGIRCQDYWSVNLSLLHPQGLRIEVDDIPGATLAAVHYSINAELKQAVAGKWNFDIRSKTGNKWVHENRAVKLKTGDEVNYWVYIIVNGLGIPVTNQRWVASKLAQPPTTAKPTSSVGDQLWNGRKLKLVMEDTFDGGINTKKWEHEISLWGGGNGEFQAYTNLPENSFTKNGALFLKPTATADKYGEKFLTSGTWDVKKMYGACTMIAANGCKKEGKNGYLNPALSAKLRSKKGIRYGKVEIIAKLPRGDWIWPALWMLPNYGVRHGGGSYGNWPQSGEIDIMEARSNRHYGNIGIEYMGSTLHWGTKNINKFQMTSARKKVSSGTLADGYHKYTFYWDQRGMDFYLDDEKVTRFATPNQGFFRWGNLPGNNIWANANNAPFDKEFYLIMNVAVGGTSGYYPDNAANAGYTKPWLNKDKNAYEKFGKAAKLWKPTWKGDDAAMQVDSVRMWQLE